MNNEFKNLKNNIPLNLIDCRGIQIKNDGKLGKVIKMRRCNYIKLYGNGEDIWLDYNDGIVSNNIYLFGNIGAIYDFETKSANESGKDRHEISGNFTSSAFVNLPAPNIEMLNGVTIFKTETNQQFRNIPLCRKGFF